MKPLVKKQQGLSLVELLIAMGLGLLLTVGGLQMMLASQNIYRTTDSLSRIQESGRFALAFLAQDIRMAGYNTEDSIALYDLNCDSFSPCTADGGGAVSDRIAIMLEPRQAMDCLGNTVAKPKDVVNVYYLQTTSNISSLYCRGYNPSAKLWNGAGQPLIDGVENFQILYGLKNEDSDGKIQFIERYVPASDGLDYSNVAAVRIALLVNNGQANGSGDRALRNFTLLNAPQQLFNDNHERQIYTTTIAINNAVYVKTPQ
ncbi:MAG: PilW family protein [Paraglaciecola sp.]|nr:PilW family protein [Paraglaciecola sp.]